MSTYSTQQLAQRLGGELSGPGDLAIRGMASLERATADQLTFVRESKHVARLASSQAGAVLAPRGLSLQGVHGRAIIVVSDVDLAVATVLECFAPPLPLCHPGVHPTAVIDASAHLGRDVCIGPHVYVGPRAVIADHCVLYANVCVLDAARLGRECRLYPGSVVGERCELGERCILQNNVSLGADGFNYRPAPDGSGLRKIPHVGNVKLGDDVEIGAGTCIDRGKFDATEIGSGSKLDNLCQIGHNCRIGRCCVIAGACAIGGSAKIGDGVQMGGHSMVKDHVSIGAGARVAGGAAVTSDVPPGATYMGYPAREISAALREYAAIRKLPRLLTRWRKRFPDESDRT